MTLASECYPVDGSTTNWYNSMLRVLTLLLFLPTATLAERPDCVGEPDLIRTCEEVRHILTGFVSKWDYKVGQALVRYYYDLNIEYYQIIVGTDDYTEDADRIRVAEEIATEMCSVISKKTVKITTFLESGLEVTFTNACWD